MSASTPRTEGARRSSNEGSGSEETDPRPDLDKIVSLCYRKGKLGIAIWMQDDSPVIRLMEEQPELPGYPSVESSTNLHPRPLTPS